MMAQPFLTMTSCSVVVIFTTTCALKSPSMITCVLAMTICIVRVYFAVAMIPKNIASLRQSGLRALIPKP